MPKKITVVFEVSDNMDVASFVQWLEYECDEENARYERNIGLEEVRSGKVVSHTVERKGRMNG